MYFGTFNIQQTKEKKVIAEKIANMPCENKSRTVVITQGSEPTIVVKGQITVFVTFLM